jgi:hypothetical protein
MAGAGNVSAAQNTRLLIEFPLGKANIELCQILLSRKISDVQLQDELKRVLSTSLNTVEVKHPFASHDLDAACKEALRITQSIIDFSSIELVPARRAKEKSRSDRTFSNHGVYAVKCQVFRDFCVDKLQSHCHFTQTNLLDAFNQENPESRACIGYFREIGPFQDMKREARTRAIEASDVDFTDDEIRASFADFSFFAYEMLRADPTTTKKRMIEEYCINVTVRGIRFYSPIKHFQKSRITWDGLLRTINSMQKSVVSPEGRALGIVSSSGEAANLAAAAGSSLSVFEGEDPLITRLATAFSKGLECSSVLGSPCQSPPPPHHQQSLGAFQFGLTQHTLKSDEKSCGAKRSMDYEADECKRRKTAADLNEHHDFEGTGKATADSAAAPAAAAAAPVAAPGMAAAEEDGGHGGSGDDEEALERGDDFDAGPQGRESEGPDQRRRVSEDQTAGMVAPAAGAATPTAQLLAAAAGGDSAVVTTDGFGAGQTNVETPSSVGPVGWELETKPLDEIQQEKHVRTLEDAHDCLKRLSSELRLLESPVVSEGAVADELNKKLLCIRTLLDHIMGTALNSSESPLRYTVFEKSTQLSTELDRLSSIMDSHQRSRDSAVEDRAGLGAGSHDTYHADAQGVTQTLPTAAAAEAKVDTVDAVELAAKEAEAEAEAAEAEAEEAEAEAAEAAEAAERAEAVAVAASSERVALGPSTEASAQQSPSAAASSLPRNGLAEGFNDKKQRMEEAQLLLQALSALAATGDIGDSAGEAIETKNGGGADAASVHDGTLLNKIPARYRKDYLAEKARNMGRKMAVQSRKMAVSSVKKVSTSSIPSTSELVALGPSTAASAQQSPSAATSSLPRNGLATKRDREPLQDQVAQTQDCCMKSSKQRKITYDMFNRNSDGATMNDLGISGSISFSGVKKMFDKVPPEGHLFIDLGVGHGRMIALAMESGAYSAAGIELKENMLSCHPLFESVIQGAGINPFLVNIRYGDISELQGLGPATYVFSFWNSMSLQTRMAILLLLSESPTARVFACSNIPGKESIQGVLTELNKHSGSAPWDLCHQFKTTVLGNAMSSEIWIFKRNPEQTLSEKMVLTGKIHSFLTFDSDLWRVMQLSNPKVRARNDSQKLTRVNLDFWKIGEFLTKRGIRVLKRVPNRADGSGPIVRVVQNGVIRELLISSYLHSDDSADAGKGVFKAIIPPISEGEANPLDVNLRASAFDVSSCAGQFSQPANSAAATGREFGEEEENTSANCCVGSRGSCSPGANKSKSAADGLNSLRESDYLLKEASESVLMFQGDIDRSVFKRLREVLTSGNDEMNICGLVKKDVCTVLGTTWFNDEVITWGLKLVCSTVTGGEFADFDTFFGVFPKGGKPTIVFNSQWVAHFFEK